MANNIPPEAQADLRALALAATPEPWEAEYQNIMAYCPLVKNPTSKTELVAESLSREDSALIVAMRNNILALLDSLAEAVRERDAAIADKNEMVARNKLLRNRPDLPIERVKGYDELMAERDTLQADNERLAGVVAAVKSALPTPEQIELAEPSDDFDPHSASGGNYGDAYSMGIERGINLKSKQLWAALAAAKEKGKAE